MPDLGGEVVKHVDTFEGAPGSRRAEVGLGVDNAGCALATETLRSALNWALNSALERSARHGPDFFYSGVLYEALEQLAP